MDASGYFSDAQCKLRWVHVHIEVGLHDLDGRELFRPDQLSQSGGVREDDVPRHVDYLSVVR